MAVLMGAEACEGSDDLADREIADMVACLGDQVADSGRGRVVAFTVLDVDCCRSDDQISVNGGSDQDALTELCGLRKIVWLT